jgi:hypothetical protein
VSQPIDIVQRSLPEPELLVLEAVEQIERSNGILFSGFEVGCRYCLMSRLTTVRLKLEQNQLISVFA